MYRNQSVSVFTRVPTRTLGKISHLIWLSSFSFLVEEVKAFHPPNWDTVNLLLGSFTYIMATPLS